MKTFKTKLAVGATAMLASTYAFAGTCCEALAVCCAMAMPCC